MESLRSKLAKRWTHGWTMQKTLVFVLKTQVLFWVHHDHVRKDTRLSLHIHLPIPKQGSLRMRLCSKLRQLTGTNNKVLNSHPAIFLVRVWWSTRLAPTVQQQYLEKMSHWESWSPPLPQRATPRCLHLALEFLTCSVNVCGRMASIQPQLGWRNSMAVWRLQQLG